MQTLLAAGRRAEAEAFQRSHAEAVEVGKVAVTRDLAECIEATHAREGRAQRRIEKRLQLERWNAEDQASLDHAARTGYLPGGHEATAILRDQIQRRIQGRNDALAAIHAEATADA